MEMFGENVREKRPGEMSGEMFMRNVRGKCPGEVSREYVRGNLANVLRKCLGKFLENARGDFRRKCPSEYLVECSENCQEEMTKGNVSGDVEKMSGCQLIGNISRAGQEASAGILRKVDSRNLIPEGGAT